MHLCDLELSKTFLDKIPKAQATQGRTDKSDFVRVKIFCVSSDTIENVTS